MRQFLKRGSFLVGAILFATASAPVWASVPNRFGQIPQRNVFALKGQEVPPQASPPEAPLPKITITGITTILGDKLVLLKAQPPAKPGVPAKEESMILAEGQREGPVEVLSIDVKSGDVKLNNAGTVMTLNLAKNGPKPPLTPPPSAVPPRIPTYSGPRSIPQGQPGAAPPLPVRVPHWPGSAAPSATGTALSPTGGGPVPPGYATPAPQSLPLQNLTPQEQAIVQQLQQTSATQPGMSSFPPMTGQGVPIAPESPPVSGTVIPPTGAKPPDTIPPGYTQPLLPQ